MIQVTLQHGLYQSRVWPAAATFGWCSLGPGGEGGARLPAELGVLPGPADSGRMMGALGRHRQCLGQCFKESGFCFGCLVTRLLFDVYARQEALVLSPTSMRLSPAGFLL